jgi:ammonia channel protein AmtB
MAVCTRHKALLHQCSIADPLPSAIISDGNWVQLGKQTAWICVGVAWTFIVTYAIMFVINLVPGLHFRASEEAEVVGMDVSRLYHIRCQRSCPSH